MFVKRDRVQEPPVPIFLLSPRYLSPSDPPVRGMVTSLFIPRAFRRSM